MDSDMTPQLAEVARGNEAANIARVKALGALKAITFKEMAAQGQGIYVVDFENGKILAANVLDETAAVSGRQSGADLAPENRNDLTCAPEARSFRQNKKRWETLWNGKPTRRLHGVRR